MSLPNASTLTRNIVAIRKCFLGAREAVQKGDPGLVARRLNEALCRMEAVDRAASRSRKSRAAS
jgi:hypothetical protein